MIALAVMLDVKGVMETHVFKFNCSLYRQKEGGAIGNELTRVVAETSMLLYIQKLKCRAEALALQNNLVWVYVDDTSVVGKKVQRGLRLSEDKSCLVWDEQCELEDRALSDNEVTARLFCDVANSIEEDIMTYDVPSRNDDGKMPVLDLNVWIDENFKIKLKFFYHCLTKR